MEIRRYSPESERTIARPPINNELLQAGDEQAWEDFITYSRNLFMTVARRNGAVSAQEAEDVCQDALLGLYQRREKVDYTDINGYVARSVVNRIRDLRRRDNRVRIVPLENMPGANTADESERGLIDTLPDQAPSPEEAALASETQVEVAAVVNSLSPTDRTTLTQQMILELKTSEAADLNGISYFAQKSRNYRAREAFRREWEANFLTEGQELHILDEPADILDQGEYDVAAD